MLLRNTQIEPQEFIDLLSNNDIVVYEDIQTSKIWVNYVNGNWVIRPKNINQKPINLVDLAMQKYYKWAWAYLISLPENVTELLRPNYYFCFEYFPDEQPANIKYEKIPDNHLILTCICKYKNKYTYDIDELKTYANLFGIETLPILYKGKLSEKQLNAINYFLNTSKRDLDLFFKDTNFSKFFYKLLNPAATNSYLKTNSFQENLEKIIIRFVNSGKEYTLEILNPLYQKMELSSTSEHSDVYSVLIFNFMQWLLTVDINEIKTEGSNREIVYINIISKLFNAYCEKYESHINDFVFVVPQFFNHDKFRVHQNLIKNDQTKEYVNRNPKLEYLFKIILSAFQRKHKKEIGIINNIALNHLNDLTRKIQVQVEQVFNYNQKMNNYSYQQNLSDYANIEWEKDSMGYVYPEIGTLFNNTNTDSKKKLDKKK